MPVNEIITGLAAAIGPAGAEGAAARLAMELLGDYAPVRKTPLGSVIAELGDRKAKEHILLDAHIDEIGMIVTRVDDKGFLHVDRTGGVDRRTLAGAEVTVLGKKRLSGVICSTPPHLAKGDSSKVPDWDGIYIDIGCGAERTRELVPCGSRVVVRSRPLRLLGERIACKALDNRAGAAALIRTVELLEPESSRLPCRVSIVLSTQEETGGQGATTSAFDIAPTQCVTVDTGFAQQPGVAPEKCGKLGKGAMIGASPVLDRRITMRLRELAEEHKIAWQHDIMGGSTGTNADNIASSRGGVRTGLVSIPLRNMHTAVEIVDKSDIESTARLLAEFVKAGGAVDA